MPHLYATRHEDSYVFILGIKLGERGGVGGGGGGGGGDSTVLLQSSAGMLQICQCFKLNLSVKSKHPQEYILKKRHRMLPIIR